MMKSWRKPAVATLSEKELSTVILASARSGGCGFAFFR